MEFSLLFWIATGLGLGLSPLFPGTAGALLGIPIAHFASRRTLGIQVVIALSLVVIAVPLCHWASLEVEGKDDGRIVADEFLTFPIATAALPCAKHPALLGSAFVISRLLDHLKPPPAAQSEQVPGGIGIVLDDVVSNLYTALLCLIGYALYLHRGRRRGGPSSPKGP